MRYASFTLSTSLSQKFQIKGNAPNIAVYVRQRYWDHPDIANINEGIDPQQEWYQLTNRAISLEIMENVDQFASSFTVIMSNEEGELAPDNYPLKWPLEMKFRGHQLMAYQKQLFPNNEVKICLGYGDDLISVIHGFIEDTKISAEGNTVAISCMTAYKQVLHQTARKAVKTPTGNLFDVLKFIFKLAGVTLLGEKMVVPGTDEEWTIKKPIEISRGQAYDEIVREILDTTFFFIRANDDGTCTLIPTPRYTDIKEFDVTLDEYVNLTALDYTATDRDVHAGVTVKNGNHANSWYNPFLLNTVSLKRFKEEIIECAWANTFLKRREVASAAHLRNLYRWRTLSVGVVMDPRLQLFDRVRVAEQTSSATGIYHIKGILTMVSAVGAFQVLDLANVYDYRPIPRSDEPLLNAGGDTAIVKLKRLNAKDKPDTVNIYVNDKIVAKNVALNTTASSTTVKLNKGQNYITVEGVTCKNKQVTANLEITNSTGGVIKKTDFVFEKTGVSKDYIYEKRPSISYVVTY